MNFTRRSAHRLVYLHVLMCFVPLSCGFHGDGYRGPEYRYTLNSVRTDGTDFRVLAEDVIEAISTDSVILFFAGDGRMYALRNSDSSVTPLLPSIEWQHKSVTPFGNFVLLSTVPNYDQQDGSYFYLLNSTMGELTKLNTPKGEYIQPSISPDLRNIVYLKDNEMWTITSDGNTEELIAPDTDTSSNYGGIFSTDTTIVYFQYVRSMPQIRFFNTDDHSDRLIASFFGQFPTYGRVLVGPKLLQVHGDTIKILDIFTSQVTSLALAKTASFSNDGSRIAACYYSRVFVIDSNGANATTIYTEKDPRKMIRHPQFTSDNAHVIFVTATPIN